GGGGGGGEGREGEGGGGLGGGGARNGAGRGRVRHHAGRVAPYSLSVTSSPHWVSAPSSGASQMARWVMKCSGAAPCQCHSPGGVRTVSPGRITITPSARETTRPMPSVTCRVCPTACMCHAVRAAGVKCTGFTRARDGSSPR